MKMKPKLNIRNTIACILFIVGLNHAFATELAEGREFVENTAATLLCWTIVLIIQIKTRKSHD